MAKAKTAAVKAAKPSSSAGPIERGKRFVQDAYAELKKVSWPTRNDLRGSTTVVIIAVIIIAIFIGIVDRIFSIGLEQVLRNG